MEITIAWRTITCGQHCRGTLEFQNYSAEFIGIILYIGSDKNSRYDTLAFKVNNFWNHCNDNTVTVVDFTNIYVILDIFIFCFCINQTDHGFYYLWLLSGFWSLFHKIFGTKFSNVLDAACHL